MKWFKHDSDAHRDPKLRKLMLKYGVQGYGLYFYCLELIASNVGLGRLTFELEHDSELIAIDTNISRELVEDMMRYMVNLGLFENTDGKVSCLKLLSRIDQSQSGNPKFRAEVAALKAAKNHDPVMTLSSASHDSVSTEVEVEVEVDNTRKNLRELNVSFEDFWARYPRKAGKANAEKKWPKLTNTDREQAFLFISKNPYADRDRQYIPQGDTFLNKRPWEDDDQPSSQSSVGGVRYFQ